MSKDRDIIFELVTSKYKIADKNRRAKYRFFSRDAKRRGSEPTEECDKVAPKKTDLSLPGTPVNSRYLSSLQNNQKPIETDSEDEKPDRDELIKQNTIGILDESFKKFTSNMLSLQDQPVDLEINFAETTRQTKSVKAIQNENKNVETVDSATSKSTEIESEIRKPIVISSKQFNKDEYSKTGEILEIKGDFKVNGHSQDKPSDNTSENKIVEVNKSETAEEVVKKYFDESTRRGSYQRDFLEAVEAYESKPKPSEEKDSGIDLLIPGVPVSSKKLFGFSFGRKKKKAIKLEALPKPDINIAKKENSKTLEDSKKQINNLKENKNKIIDTHKIAEPIAKENILPEVSKKIVKANDDNKIEPAKVHPARNYTRRQSVDEMQEYFINSGRRSSYQKNIADIEPPKISEVKQKKRRQSVDEMEDYFIHSGRRSSYQKDIEDLEPPKVNKSKHHTRKTSEGDSEPRKVEKVKLAKSQSVESAGSTESPKSDHNRHYIRRQSTDEMAEYFIQSGRRSSYQEDIAGLESLKPVSEVKQRKPKQSTDEMEDYFIHSGRRSSYQKDIEDLDRPKVSKSKHHTRKPSEGDSEPQKIEETKHVKTKSVEKAGSTESPKHTRKTSEGDSEPRKVEKVKLAKSQSVETAGSSESPKSDHNRHYIRRQSTDEMAEYFIQSGRRSSYQKDIADLEPPKISETKRNARRQSVEDMEDYFIQSGRRNSYQNDLNDQLKGLKSKTAFALKKQQSLDLSVPGTTVSSKHIRRQKSENVDNEKKVTLSNSDNDDNIKNGKEIQQLSSAIDNCVLYGEEFDLKGKKSTDNKPKSSTKPGIIKQVKLKFSNFMGKKKPEAVAKDTPKQNGHASDIKMNENGVKPLIKNGSTATEPPQKNEISNPEIEKLNEKSLKIKNIDLTVPGVTISSTYIESLITDKDDHCNGDVTIGHSNNEIIDAEIKNFVENTFEDNKREIFICAQGNPEQNNSTENEKLLTEALINEVIHELNAEKNIDPKLNNSVQNEDTKNNLEFDDLASPKLILNTIQSNHLKEDTSKDENDIMDIEDLTLKTNRVEKYFDEMDGKDTFQKTDSEIQDSNEESNQTKLQIDKYFEESEEKKTFARSFTEVMSFADTIEYIVKSAEVEKSDTKEMESDKNLDSEIVEDKEPKDRNQVSRTSSFSSITSSVSNTDVIHPPKKHGKKKYGVDKYFATTLYKSAHQRSPSLRSMEDQTGDDITGEVVQQKANVQEAIEILNDLEALNDDIENDPSLKAEFWRNYLKEN
jgi:hypothetical protein